MIDEQQFIMDALDSYRQRRTHEAEEAARHAEEQRQERIARLRTLLHDCAGLDVAETSLAPDGDDFRIAGIRFSVGETQHWGYDDTHLGPDYRLCAEPDYPPEIVRAIEDGWQARVRPRPIHSRADVGQLLTEIEADQRAPFLPPSPPKPEPEPAFYHWLTVVEMNRVRAAGRDFAIVSVDHENDAVLVEYLDVPTDDGIAIGWDGAVAAARSGERAREEWAELLAQLAEARRELEVTRIESRMTLDQIADLLEQDETIVTDSPAWKALRLAKGLKVVP